MMSRPQNHSILRLAAVAVFALATTIAARPTSAQDACTGDCDADGSVFVDEIVAGVSIALGMAELAECSAFDSDDSDSVEVDEVIQGVNNALNGCPSQGVIRFDRLVLAADQQLRVRGGTTIIAENGMEIAGDIIAEGRGGDLTLQAENGDIVLIGGSAGFVNAPEPPDDPPFPAAASAPRPRGPDTTTHGGNLFVWAKAGIVDLQRHPTSGKLPHLVAQDGEAGVDLRVINWIGQPQGDITADDGGDGGDIVITGGEGIGELSLPPAVDDGEGPVLRVGSGGRGGTVNIDSNFETDTQGLTISGGNGGRSGSLRLQSIAAVEVPPRANAALIVTGRGGRGGWVYWQVADRSAGATLPLLSLTMIGGRGGDGLSDGGNGAFAVFQSGVLINRRGAPITPVSLYGGRGGDVFGAPAPIAVINAIAGDGAVASGIGNRGWDGGAADDGTIFNNGAKGGSLTAVAGNGGDILASVIADFGHGGDGGDCPTILATEEPDFIAGGPGGNGHDTCDGCAGGNGGNSGDLLASAGDGGSIAVFADLESFLAGDGGGVAGNYGTLAAGNGGDGNAPGSAGSRGLVSVAVGRGGVRGGTPGDDGTFTGDEILQPNAEPGESCGEASECCANPPCEQCCPQRCELRSPPNDGIRTLRYKDETLIEGILRVTDVTGAYNPCGERDEFGNCRGNYTFTCVSDGIPVECAASTVALLDLEGMTGGYLIDGGAFCFGVGNLCVGDGRTCRQVLSGGGLTSTRTWQCTNCGNFGPTCAAETFSGCQCLNFSRTGPGIILVCPPPCAGSTCGGAG